MKIATYNVNGISAACRICWTGCDAKQPDVACLQELKAPDERFPGARDFARPDTARSGMGRSHGTASPSWRRGASRSRSGAACPAIRTTRTAATSRRQCDGLIVGCLYLPNGNPQPGPKFDYKLAWFERLIEHAKKLFALEAAGGAGWATSTSCPPTSTSTTRSPGRRMRCCSRKAARPTQRLLKQGWTDAIREHASGRAHLHLLGLLPQSLGSAMRGLRIDHLLLNEPATSGWCAMRMWTAGCAASRMPATTRRRGWNWQGRSVL